MGNHATETWLIRIAHRSIDLGEAKKTDSARLDLSLNPYQLGGFGHQAADSRSGGVRVVAQRPKGWHDAAPWQSPVSRLFDWGMRGTGTGGVHLWPEELLADAGQVGRGPLHTSSSMAPFEGCDGEGDVEG